ncbi:MAG: AAA family ATPase [Chitinophagales bacterium]
MRKIYLKNFKGFSEACFELKDVNFLVGENSTGKTSILKLINLLSSSEFWQKFSFNNNEVELGYFEEIMLKNATAKTFIIATEFSFNKKQNKISILIVFEEKKGIPHIKLAKYTLLNKDILLKFNAQEISYATKAIQDYEFESWVKDFDFVANKLQKIRGINSDTPFNIIISYIAGFEDISDMGFWTEFDFAMISLYSHYKWLAPIRAKAKRIYENFNIKYSPEGEHIPVLLKNLLNNNADSEELIETLENFGKQSRLFDKIEVREFGTNKNAPFEINVLYDNLPMILPNVGYGVSQILPLIIEILSAEHHLFSIQQPEVHLHPKAQAAFGQFIFNAFKTNENQFLIETHSDFTINRFRYALLKEEKDNKPTAQVLFFERHKLGTTLTSIEINEKGEFVGEIPDSYHAFFIDEELKLLEL